MRQLTSHLSQLAGQIIYLVPVLLLSIYWVTNPFSQTVLQKHASLAGLSRAQKINVETSAKAVSGVVLKPGEEFSFNRIVGPRSRRRGYAPAPSYLGTDSPVTEGGGICLLSSLLYQTALEAGLDVQERTPHLRTIKTVPPGLDATVWYGKSDLRFVNSLDCPIEILSQTDPQMLRIEFRGQPSRLKRWDIYRREIVHSADKLLVEVVSAQNGNQHLISRDLYQLNP